MSVLDTDVAAVMPSMTIYASTLSTSAMQKAGLTFNPSKLPEVDRLKLLAAAFIDECERQRVAKPDAGREFSVAITEMQTAQMWAVKAATLGI